MESNDDFTRTSKPLTPLTPALYDGQDSERKHLMTASISSIPSPKAFNNGTGVEHTPRVLLESRFLRGVLAGTWLIHFVAVLFTAGVVQFTFRRFYWFDENSWENQWVSRFGVDQDVVMNGLQFVAKVHEIIIVASVSAMVMHFCRRMLVGDGIPFGFLTGAYQISSAEWLFSKKYLWAAMPRLRNWDRKGYMSSWKHVFMGVGAAAVCIYCNMVGPSSAIVIIPELSWWEVPDAFGQLGASYVSFLLNNTYPESLWRTEDFSYYCDPVEGRERDLFSFCPGYGYDELAKWAETFSLGGPSSMDITQHRSGVRRELTSTTMGLEDISTSNSSNENLLAVATTPHSSLAELAMAFWSYVEAHDIATVLEISRPQIFTDGDVFSPLVQVQCKWFSYIEIRGLAHDNQSSPPDVRRTPHFDTSAMRNFGTLAEKKVPSHKERDEGHGVASLPEKYWNYARDDRSLLRTNFTWVNVTSMFPADTFSLGSVLEVPVSLTNGTSEPYQDSLIIPCVMDVRWAGVDLSLDPRLDRLLRNNLSDLAKSLGHHWNTQKPPEKSALQAISTQSIPISLEWAELLNQPINLTRSGDAVISNTTAISSLIEQFVYYTEEEQLSFTPPLFKRVARSLDVADSIGRTVATVLSHVLADGVSRVSYMADLRLVLQENSNGTIKWVDLTNISGGSLKEPENGNSSSVDAWTPVRWNLRKYGYGYGLVSRTITFGVVILLIHAATVLLYTFYVLAFRLSKHGWSSSAWGTLDKILLLAITSRPSDTTQYSGTGIMSNELFRSRARVRERGDDGVELLVGEDVDEGHKLGKGSKYL